MCGLPCNSTDTTALRLISFATHITTQKYEKLIDFQQPYLHFTQTT